MSIGQPFLLQSLLLTVLRSGTSRQIGQVPSSALEAASNGGGCGSGDAAIARAALVEATAGAGVSVRRRLALGARPPDDSWHALPPLPMDPATPGSGSLNRPPLGEDPPAAAAAVVAFAAAAPGGVGRAPGAGGGSIGSGSGGVAEGPPAPASEDPAAPLPWAASAAAAAVSWAACSSLLRRPLTSAGRMTRMSCGVEPHEGRVFQ